MRKKWPLAIAATLAGVALVLRKRQPPLALPVAIEAVEEPEPVSALPATPSEESAGEGQALAVALLAAGALGITVLILIFLLPPAFVAPALAFGPIVLIGFLVGLFHFRSKGLSAGDPPS